MLTYYVRKLRPDRNFLDRQFQSFIQYSQGRSPFTPGTFNKPDIISQTLALSLWYFLVENCFQLYYTLWDIFHRFVMLTYYVLKPRPDRNFLDRQFQSFIQYSQGRSPFNLGCILLLKTSLCQGIFSDKETVFCVTQHSGPNLFTAHSL